MRSGVQGQVPVLNVGDADAAGRFYALFGYTGQPGEDGRSRLRCGDLNLLIVEGAPAPATLYLHVDDVAATTERLVAAGHRVETAPGGECRTVDPAGNTILFTRALEVPAPQAEPDGRPAPVRRAAQVAARRDGAPAHCQIGGPRGEPCTEPAEVKLADSWGDTVWGCLTHADETLVNARGAFLATEDATGLAAYLAARQARPEAAAVPG
ncbi:MULTISPECIES: VOC family protein [unclassified Micromonospora]|uniref:VOC family protein n=1 Tax=unclassified Micromonospora TaxID=2617518 RepID=UPI0022B65AAC|nr:MULTISPECIES: VOC family protein [unclassified Micromonospora]MCZ7475886.1 VOC family protein [Micromonospora sp. WMMC273]WBC00751.1 VOC family protein [Micromonospora sp. WMMA1976]